MAENRGVELTMRGPVVIDEDRRQAAYHCQRLRIPRRKRPARSMENALPNEEREPDDDDYGRHEGRREPASDEEARRHGGDRAREAKAAAASPAASPPATGAADLRQERTEGPQAKALQKQQAEEAGLVEPKEAGALT